MLANTNLKIYSVINYDMLYKYVFSSTTVCGYTPYDRIYDRIDSRVTAGGSILPEMYQVVDYGFLENDEFEFHNYDYPSSAGVKVIDSIALNPDINDYGGCYMSGSVTPSEYAIGSNEEIYIESRYRLRFFDALVYLFINSNYLNGEEGEPITLTKRSATYIVIGSDDGPNGTFTETTFNKTAYGKLEDITFSGRSVMNTNRVNSSGGTTDVGGICAERGGFLWKFSDADLNEAYWTEDEHEFIYESDIVYSNAKGYSQYNIRPCVFDSPSLTLNMKPRNISKTWKWEIAYSGFTGSNAAESYKIMLKNGSVELDRVTVATNSSTKYYSGLTSVLVSETATTLNSTWSVVTSNEYGRAIRTEVDGSHITTSLIVRPTNYYDVRFQAFTYDAEDAINTSYAYSACLDTVTETLIGNDEDSFESIEALQKGRMFHQTLANGQGLIFKVDSATMANCDEVWVETAVYSAGQVGLHPGHEIKRYFDSYGRASFEFNIDEFYDSGGPSYAVVFKFKKSTPSSD